MVSEEVREVVLRKLKEIEEQHKVKILYAIESGSRAWGFPSPDSDYDVRFIYAHNPQWYLSIDTPDVPGSRRDTIDPVIDGLYDLAGWDVKKALGLFWKSNPTLIEWLNSPIVYMDDGKFAKRAREMTAEVFLPLSGFHHYRSMAKHTWYEHMRGREEVSHKKYLYILRALLCIRHIERKGPPAPMEFRDLLWTLEDEPNYPILINAVDKLLFEKQLVSESGKRPPSKELDEFIDKEFKRLAECLPEKPPMDQIEARYHTIAPRISRLLRQTVNGAFPRHSDIDY